MLKKPSAYIEVVKNNGQVLLVPPNTSFSLLNMNADDENTIDIIQTLSNYLNPIFIDKYQLEILNDSNIYECPLAEVLDYDKFYSYVEKEYGKYE